MKPKRVDWTEGWQTYSAWPISDVLRPLGIDPSLLGIVARVERDEDGSGSIAPVLYYIQNAPKRISRYTLVFASRETLSVFRYTLTQNGSDKPVLQKEFRQEIGSGMPIVLDLDLGNYAAGFFTLSVKGKIMNQNQGPKRKYSFFHEPIVSE